MVKCPRCGYENSSSSIYCDNCAYRLSDSKGNRINNSRQNNSWNMGIGKKIVIVLGIIIVTFLLFSVIYNNTQPTSQDSLSIVADDGSNHQSSSYPYKAVIQYDGYWYAEMGDPNYLITEAGQGREAISLDCSPWDNVVVDAQKYGSDDGELKVQLLRNGEVVAENSTTSPTGSVEVRYNF